MSKEQRRNIVERPAGSIPGLAYVGIYLLLGLICAAVVGGITGSGLIAIAFVAVGLLYGTYRAWAMSRYRSAYQQEKRDAE